MRSLRVPCASRVYRSCTPGLLLREFVERIWFCSDAPAHECERIVPSGTVELVINLRENEIRIGDPTDPSRPTRRLSGAVVSGTYSRFFAIDTRQHASIMGIHFKPAGALPFLGVSLGELADSHVDLDALWGRAAGDLRELVCCAGAAEDRFRLVEDALLSRLNGEKRGRPAVSFALNHADRVYEQTGMDTTVRELARRVGLSERRFIQIFTEDVGLTPKLYSRVRRFQRACVMVRGVPSPDWAGLAVACGYFDQSHLIRDFQAFSGLSPCAYLGRGLDRVMPNHVPQVG